jgi:AcrR family transcriptional regulator
METSLPDRTNVTTHRQARAQSHELLRRNVVEAASRLLIEEGPDALTVRRVAQSLDCSTKIIYTLFQGKDGLANALYLEGCARLRQEIETVKMASSPATYIHKLAWAYWTFALANPSYYGVMFDGTIPNFQPSPTSKQVMTDAFSAIVAIIAQYIDQDLLPREEPDALTRSLWAPLHGVASLYLLGHFPSLEEARWAYERTIQAIIASLSSHSPSSTS